MSCSGDGFGGDVELDVIGVAVEVETMTMYDITMWEDVENEQERTKHRTLGDALGQGSGGGGVVVDADKLLTSDIDTKHNK